MSSELRDRNAQLYAALHESVKLQSHYAGLLNMHDGGERRKFESADAWIARLVECGTLPLRALPASAGSFLTDMATKVALYGPADEPPVRSLTEAWARLGIAVLHFEEMTRLTGDPRKTERARTALVLVAATAWLCALQLGIESRSDAIGKDIPF